MPSSSIATLLTGGPPNFRCSWLIPDSSARDNSLPRGFPSMPRPRTRCRLSSPAGVKVSIRQVCLPSGPNNEPASRAIASSRLSSSTPPDCVK